MKVRTIEELREVADDVQVVSDGAWGYIVALMPEEARNIEFADVSISKLAKWINNELLIIGPFEGPYKEWI